MNTVDRITKETKIIIDSAKDTLESNFPLAIKDSSLNLREDQIKNLLDLVKLLLDQSFQRAVPSFQNSIKKYVK